MCADELARKFVSPRDDIVDRLRVIKPRHGTYRKAQDALNEIVRLRAEKEALQTEKSGLIKRILDLESRLNQARAA